MTSYIPLDEYNQDEQVQVICKDGENRTGRVIRITPYKSIYGIASVLVDKTKELVVAQYTNKISKL